MGRRKNGQNGSTEAPETAPPKQGHNSAMMADKVREGFERYQRLHEEKKAAGEAQAEIINDLKEQFGLSKMAVRRAWNDALKDATTVQTLQSDYDTVMSALGMLAGTPLGDAALAAATAGA